MITIKIPEWSCLIPLFAFLWGIGILVLLFKDQSIMRDFFLFLWFGMCGSMTIYSINEYTHWFTIKITESGKKK